MNTAARALALIVAALVGVQAASHAWASAGVSKWVQDGGVMDKAAMEKGGADFPEILGFIVHSINGQMVIPAVSVILLVVALASRSAAAVRWAGAIAVLVALQVTLGILGHGATVLALLHGLNAVVLFGVALAAGVRRQAHGTARATARSREGALT